MLQGLSTSLVGDAEGRRLGLCEGLSEGLRLEGECDGARLLGALEGSPDGLDEGSADGVLEGCNDGVEVGL